MFTAYSNGGKMKKICSVILTILIVISFVGCDPVVRYAKEELEVIRNDIYAYLTGSDMSTYYLDKILRIRKDDVHIQDEFICVERGSEFSCAYEIDAERENMRCFYKDDTLYTLDFLLNEKLQKHIDVSKLEFFQAMDYDLDNIGKMFDSKYISKISGESFIYYRNKIGPKIIRCEFQTEQLYADSILNQLYDKISITLSIDNASNKVFHFYAEFIAEETYLTYLFATDLYDEYETLINRLKFPDDLEEYLPT